jgi:type VI secretion system protein ImpB
MKEGSVAPKERVNITYRPETGGAKEEVELPLRMLVMGDFTLREDDRPVDQREPLDVNKDNFNDVLKSQELSLDLQVENKLAGAPAEGEEPERMAVNLKFESMGDFTPDKVAEQIPELKRLIELRESLKAVKGPLGNIPEFRKKLQELISDEASRDKIMKELGIDEEG